MSRKRVKHFLQLLLAIGVIAVALGGGGTFASFNAETANPGNTFATGTLYLHDSVNGATACTSESTSTNQNVPATIGGGNPGDTCDVLFNFPASTNYNKAFTVHLALKDAGTLAGKDLKFQLNGAGCIYNDTGDTGTTFLSFGGTEATNGGTNTLNTSLVSGNAVTSIDVTGNPLARRIPKRSLVELNDNSGHTQFFIASANVAAGATAIPVVSQNANFSYPSSGTDVLSLTAINTINVTGTTTVGVASGAAIQIGTGTLGGNDTFTSSGVAPVGSSSLTITSVPLANLSTHAYSSTDGVYAAFGANNACSSIPYTITETNSNYDGPSEASTGLVANSNLLATTIANASTNNTTITLAAGGLDRKVWAGTTIDLDDGSSNTQPVVVTQDAAAGDTTIHVQSFTATHTYTSGVGTVDIPYGTTSTTTGSTTGFEGCAYPSAADDTFGGCDFSSADNIANIPTRSPSSSFDTLTLSSGGGTGSTSGHNSGTGLDAQGGTRYFIITVYPQFGDPVMGETATFEMVWHMDQA